MPNDALNLAQILWDERTALAGGEPASPQTRISIPDSKNPQTQKDKAYTDLGNHDLNAIYTLLNQDDRAALCLSGGGIRSAALGLGIVQCFARCQILLKKSEPGTEPLLKHFSYLSTVSGGGYLGSWLSAWLYQERQATNGGGANAVVHNLAERDEDHLEFEPIVNLRRDSHYLAPSFSAISPDVWADIATIARNLVLTWVLLIPPLFLAVLISQALAYGFPVTVDWATAHGHWVIDGAALVGTLCLIFALTFAVANRPTRGISNNGQTQFLRYDLIVFLVSAALLSLVFASTYGTDTAVWLVRRARVWIGGSPPPLVVGVLLGGAVYGASWFTAYLWRLTPGNVEQADRHRDFRLWHPLVDLGAWCVAGAVFGLLVAVGWWLAQWLAEHSLFYSSPQVLPLIVVVCGIPWFLAGRIIADVVFLAFVTFIPRSDGDLEYQARAGGIYMLAQLGWLIWFGLVLWASWLVSEFHWWLASVGGLSGAVSLILGSSSKTPAFVRDAANGKRYLTLNRLAGLAAAIFGAVLIIAVAAGVDRVLLPGEGLDRVPNWLGILIAGVGLALAVFAIPWVININRFSLHGLYRDRLVRTFLGASRGDQQREDTKNHFTDFDTEDTPRLYDLWDAKVVPSGDKWKPLHIINVTLNLVSSKNLAWQERKAAPFTFSPLHAGSGSSAFAEGAYRRSNARDDQKPYGGGIGLTLGTAMAISGAAVSPNMGYNSSPGVAFLMTLFNVRLGWWLGNPRSENKYYWYTGPGWALKPLVMEMFGLTSERKRWIYLSDGAHFENFGLYEMVRRRCRLIVISDGGQDPDYQFEDLGNALRKIWIDLGVRIEFVGLDYLKKRFKERPTPATDEPYWAVGQIHYREADKLPADAESGDGLILYLKAGLHGTEPMDILSYALKHPTFPHETTANQFFSESQLEAYRALGYEMADNALRYAALEQQQYAGSYGREAFYAATPPTSVSDTLAQMTLRDIVESLAKHLRRTTSPQGNSASSQTMWS